LPGREGRALEAYRFSYHFDLTRRFGIGQEQFVAQLNERGELK
jgi:hypothetical protein